MRDDVSRLVGIDGVVVTDVIEVGRQLEIEVELRVEVACCRWCGRASLAVKDRPVVRIRDLSIAGRVTFLRWRKRRYLCEACERTFTETHPALPSRQRVSARFRAHLFERCEGGGAHLEVARVRGQRLSAWPRSRYGGRASSSFTSFTSRTDLTYRACRLASEGIRSRRSRAQRDLT